MAAKIIEAIASDMAEQAVELVRSSAFVFIVAKQLRKVAAGKVLRTVEKVHSFNQFNFARDWCFAAFILGIIQWVELVMLIFIKKAAHLVDDTFMTAPVIIDSRSMGNSVVALVDSIDC